MVVVPLMIPLTTPELLPMVATEVLLLDQMPPETPLLKDIAAPWHTDIGPYMAVGVALTVNEIIAIQPCE